MAMKEQFQTKIQDVENTKLAVAGFLAILVIFGVFISQNSSSDTEKTDRIQLSVGEDAWKEPVNVNITDRINPSEVSVEEGQTVIWNNRRSTAVTIEIVNVDRSFDIASEESQIFKPSSDFEYEVIGEDKSLDSGKVVVQR